MTTGQLLERLVDAVSASTRTIKVLTPSSDYCAQPGDFCEDRFDIIDPDSLAEAIQRIRAELPDEH